MRRITALIVAVALALPATVLPASAEVGPARTAGTASFLEPYLKPDLPPVEEGDEAVLLTLGGTNLTNGYFLPGHTTYDSQTKEYTVYGPPLTVEKGRDIRWINTDPAAVTNSHQIISFKRRKKRKNRPFFKSKKLSGPGEEIIKMKNVPVGTYVYLCTTHFGMLGTVEVVKKSG